jgi:prolyl-tRNA synthetase
MMKDLYTFDINEKAAMQTYSQVREVYRLFFRRLGLPVVEAKASSGDMGGSLSHEFHILSESGEDTLHICQSCGYAENEEVSTKPAEGRIQDHNCPQCDSKTMTSHHAIEVGHTFHLGTRYSEPLGAIVEVPEAVLVDGSSLDRTATTYKSKRTPLQMGCHGIGLSRLIGATASLYADGKGLRWPFNVFPMSAIIVFDGKADDVPGLEYIFNALNFIRRSRASTVFPFTAWLDDRPKPLSWKLKDADLVGYPLVIVLGRKWLETGEYEIQCRFDPQLSTTSKDLTSSVRDILNNLDPDLEGTDIGRRGWWASQEALQNEQLAARHHPLQTSKASVQESNNVERDSLFPGNESNSNNSSTPIRKDPEVEVGCGGKAGSEERQG